MKKIIKILSRLFYKNKQKLLEQKLAEKGIMFGIIEERRK